jgi:hypothetical protein
MYLVQILLPLADDTGRRFQAGEYARVRSEMTERYGGITSFTRAPAKGTWTEGGHTEHDDLVVFEIMTRELDHRWWEDYRAELERRFLQEAIVMRAIKVEML